MSVFLHRNAVHRLIWYRLRGRRGTWLETVTVHHDGRSLRPVLTPFLGHLVMSATSAHHPVCMYTNHGTACVLLRVLPFLLQSVCFLGLFTLSSLLFLLLFLLQLPLLLRLSSHPDLLPNRSTLALRNLFFNNGPVSSRDTPMSMVYTHLFTSSLMTVPSRLFRMR